MSTVSGKIDLAIAIDEVLATVGDGGGVLRHKFAKILDLANGTADGQINKVYSKVETGIGAGVTTVYDLIGTLTDKDGATINFDEVVLLVVGNLSSTAANVLEVGPDATAGFGVLAANKGFWKDASDRSVLPADGDSWLVRHSKGGVPAVAGSTDELAVITQSGTSANTWFILIAGRDNP